MIANMPAKLTFPKVKVRRSSAGLGLFADEDIKKGAIIIEYVGNRMPTAEANKKGGKYLFEVNTRTTIDGSPRWNIARYANYACKDNAEAVLHGSRVMIEAKRKILAGEEITYDYGKEYYDEFIRPHGCACASCAAGNPPKYA